MAKRIAVVTGGIGDLGAEICRKLARAGRRVIAADLDRDAGRLARFRQGTAEFADDIAFAPLDVTDFDACARFVAQVTSEHGGIDILVTAAGITRDASLRKMTQAQWHDLLRVNLDGVFNLARHVVEGMCQRGFGRIVTLSSVNGQTGQFGQTNYSAAKAGIHGFVMALARETARKGVTVNTVAPGYCRSDMVNAVPAPILEQIVAGIPVGRLAEPAEIAHAVRFLTEDEAAYITGALIPVNGGYFMSF